MKMWQWFHAELDDVLLFEQWKIQNTTALLCSCIFVGTVAFLLEFLKYSRFAAAEKKIPDEEERRTMYGGILIAGNRKNPKFWSNHTIQTIYHFWQTLLAFILMNMFMTFNVYICLSLCLGLSLGYFVFASRIY